MYGATTTERTRNGGAALELPECRPHSPGRRGCSSRNGGAALELPEFRAALAHAPRWPAPAMEGQL